MKLRMALIVTLALGFLAVTHSGTPRLMETLVGAYGFEESKGSETADASANHRPETLVNATRTTGKIGTGLALNGTTSYLRIDAPG